MIGPTLPAPATGNLMALLPGAAPPAVHGGLPGSSGEPGVDSQVHDFANFIAFALGGGNGTPVPSMATGQAAGLLADGTPAAAAGPPPAPLATLRMLAAGGSFTPPPGSPLPPALPMAGAMQAAGAAALVVGQDAALTALAAANTEVAAGTIRPGPMDALAPVLATAAGPGLTTAPWLRALIPGDRGAAVGELASGAAGDAITAGDALLTPTGGARGTAPTTTVVLPSSPAQQAAFDQALGERLAWLVQEGRQDARIKLHPAELGSIDIRLSLDGDATRISLASPHAAVRDALEQAVPRLRELLGHAGFDLSQVDVGAGDARSPGDFGRPASPSAIGPDFAAAGRDAEPAVASVTLRLPQGLVDTFA